MRPHYDLAIIGLGIMGSSAMYAATRKGLSVIGFDQSPILPHRLGSSHGQTRVIRQAYFEHPDYVPLVQRAYNAWRHLEQDAERTLLHQTGGLMMGLPDSAVVTGAMAAAQRHNLPYELWDASTVKSRYPLFSLRDAEVAVYEEAAGYLLAEAAWDAFIVLAESRGATIRRGTRVDHWQRAHTSVIIHCGDGPIEADRLIITVGPWIKTLWPLLPVSVERQVPFWLDGPGLDSLSDYPIFIHENPDSRKHTYGFPYRAGEGFKVARHHGGLVTTADTVDRTVHSDDESALRVELDFLPIAKRAAATASQICLYTNTPDEHFVVGLLPGHENAVVVGAGFSGHGFKFASILGSLMVEQVSTSTSLPELALFSPERFIADIGD